MHAKSSDLNPCTNLSRRENLNWNLERHLQDEVLLWVARIRSQRSICRKDVITAAGVTECSLTEGHLAPEPARRSGTTNLIKKIETGLAPEFPEHLLADTLLGHGQYSFVCCCTFVRTRGEKGCWSPI